MESRISGHTQLFCLIGSPVGHSGSPAMYNYTFQRLGIDAAYMAFEAPLDNLAAGMAAIKTFRVGGFNITMPCKTAVKDYLDDLSPAAALIGACNTVTVGEDGKLTGHNTDGSLSDRSIGYYSARAKGGPRKPCLFTDETVPGFKAAADACHQYGAKVSIQLQHAGPKGNSKLTGFPLKAASPIPAAEGREVPEAIGKEELYRLIECYGDAARRAQMSGIDTVEVHCAHGYLVSTFISQRTNNRTDEFGGCFENRMRLARLIIENIRQKTGGNLPIFCRINAGDEVPGGQTVQDAAAVAAYLEQECGVDALHITRAIHLADEFMWTPGVTHGGFNADLVTEIKKAVSIPIIAVGRFTELGGNFRIAAYPTGKGQITEAIRSMIVKCEQAGVDLQTGTEAAVKSILALQPDAVILATGSNPLILKIPGLSECGYVTAQDLLDGKARMGKRVLVVGGGMVGCEAAEFLAERGHDVVPENRKFMFDNFTRHGVELRPGAKVGQFYPDGVDYALMDGTAGSMREYDSIVLAMGSRSSDPLSEALKETVPQVFAIGEAAKAPGNAALATGDALDAALAI